jgi:hypothetical protein
VEQSVITASKRYYAKLRNTALVTVPLNDALSTFKIVAVADAATGLFGTGSTSIRSTQDLQIISGLPPLVREDDQFRAQLTLNLGELPESVEGLSSAEKRRLTIRRKREQEIDKLFHDWTEWFERTRKMVADPNPHVDVKAVFVG